MANRITMLVIVEDIIVLILIMSVIIRPIIVTIIAMMCTDGHYRIRHDRMTYDMHRRRDFNIAVRPPQKDHHRPATPPQTSPNRPQIHPGQAVG